MFCSLSGQRAVVPVVSPKSGRVFERSTLEAYVRERGSDPISGDALGLEEIVVVSADPGVPVAPSVSGIPGLLTELQTQYDALVLEVFTLRQNLESSRKELSTALYRNDAALRVITRLTAERDEAREALSTLQSSDAFASGPWTEADIEVNEEDDDEEPTEAVEAEENQFFSETLSADIKSTKKVLFKERKAFNKAAEPFVPEILNPIEGSTVITNYQDKALITREETVDLVTIATGEVIQSYPGSAGIFTNSDEPAVYNSGVLAYGDGTFELVNKESVLETPIAWHPAAYFMLETATSLEFLDKDLASLKGRVQIPSSVRALHPDGELLIYSTNDNVVFFNLTGAGIVLEVPGTADNIAASNNGFLVAWSNQESLYVKDLRNDEDPQVYSTHGKLRFDNSGNYLAVLNGHLLQIWHYEHKAITLLSEQETTALDIAWAGTQLVQVHEAKKL